MNWIQLYNGGRYYLDGPKAFDAVDLDVETIATSLSRIPRHVGQLRTNINVAHHSVAVGYLTKSLGGLMHDATEVITNDIPRPIKLLLGEHLKAIEYLIWLSIARRFGIDPTLPKRIKWADNFMLKTETKNHAAGKTDDWAFGEVELYNEGDLPRYLQKPIGHRRSASMFIQMYRQLGGK